MREFILTIFLSLFVFQSSYTQGIYESYIIMDVNSGGNTYYNLNATTGNGDFNGNNFGVFSTGNTLYLKGFEHKVYEQGCSFVYSRLFYKVEESSNNSASYSMLAGAYAGPLGGNDHKWLNNTANVNLLDGLAPGNYKITVYGEADTSCQGPVYDSNLGSNYVATFSIINYSSDTTISTGKSFTDLTVDPGVTLTIAKNGSLTTTGNFTNNGTVTLNSDADEFATIIVQGSSTGDIVYNRYTNTVGSGEWDLIGSPVDGLSISSFVSTNSTPLATSGSIYAVGTYDNSNDTWTNYTTSSVGGAGNFDIGRGYQMATTSGATMAFTGTVATSDQTQSIINNAGNGGRRWNLVANPFPSYLNANDNADGTNNFLKVNLASGVIDATYSAIYGWDADTSGYTIYNHASAATYIAPGQAFFVAAASSSAADLSFTEAMQTATGGDDFIAGRLANTSSMFYLKLYEEQNFVADTKFYFDNNLTLGLDPGYDAGAYDQSMDLMSRLVENDQGVGMGINAMSTESFEQTTIPLVVNRNAGTTFRISLEAITIPEDVELFLEDTQAQTYTNLRTEDFILTPDNELSGMGRFYLRIGNSSLGVNDPEDSYVRVYKPNNSDYIAIEGLVNVQKARIKLYNLIGQEIIHKVLSNNQTNYRISTQGIPQGVYVIKLQFENSKITKKLIIN
jgi:trimeric autotransporter adhesin